MAIKKGKSVRWKNERIFRPSLRVMSRAWKSKLSRFVFKNKFPFSITDNNVVCTQSFAQQVARFVPSTSAGHWFAVAEESFDEDWRRFRFTVIFKTGRSSQKVRFTANVHRSGWVLFSDAPFTVSSNLIAQRLFATRSMSSYRKMVQWRQHLTESNEQQVIQYLETLVTHVSTEFLRTLRQLQQQSRREQRLVKMFSSASVESVFDDLCNFEASMQIDDLDLPIGAVVALIDTRNNDFAATGVIIQRDDSKIVSIRLDHPVAISKTASREANRYLLVEPFAELEDALNVYRVLQNTNPLGLPMKEYFVWPSRNIESSKLFADVKLFDLSPIMKDKTPHQLYPLYNFSMWPNVDQFELDKYQLHSLFTSLTKEFSIILGTPGSGKSRLLQSIVKLLIANFETWNCSSSPVLIISETNVNLDQIIKSLMDFTPDILRVGGYNCADADLKKFHLQTYITPTGTVVPFRRIHQHGNRLESKFDLLEKLYKYVLPEDEFEPVMSAKHLMQMKEYDECAETFKCSGMAFWLSVFTPSSKIKRHNTYLPPLPDDIQNSAAEPMTQAEVDKVDDVWKLPLDQRWRLYEFWQKRMHDYLVEHIRELQIDSSSELEVNDPVDLLWFRNTKVICATTSSAIRFRDFFEMLQPRILIFDESAERSEQSTVASLVTTTEQVLVISDYIKQPLPVSDSLPLLLSKNVSCVDRLTKLGADSSKLLLQHRMRSLMANLIVPSLHPPVEHDSRTFSYPSIRSVMRTMFFVNHHVFEDSQKTNTRSHSNEFEANFLVCFCRYLIETGTEPSEITLLSPYKLQVLRMKNLLEHAGCGRDVQVATLDNYHGKENEIVLVSFVRSNRRLDLGFLSQAHRIAMALTRAKRALYCIGNFDFLNAGSVIWRRVLDNIHEEHVIGRYIKLRCPQHPRSMTNVGSVEDFNLVPEGSCGASCRRKLTCGHFCPRKCHMDDREHTKITCVERCSKIVCPAGHTCPLACFQKCPDKCFLMVEKRPQSCSHIALVPCHKSNLPVKCTERCERILPCGHLCEGLCGEPCLVCQIPTVKLFLKCYHSVTVPCYRNDDSIECMYFCTTELPCGHIWQGPCKMSNVEKKCQQTVLHKFNCGHFVEGPCSSPVPFCPVIPCRKLLLCGHMCLGACGEAPCPPCSVFVDGNIPCSQYRLQLQQQLVSYVATLSHEAALSTPIIMEHSPFLDRPQKTSVTFQESPTVYEDHSPDSIESSSSPEVSPANLARQSKKRIKRNRRANRQNLTVKHKERKKSAPCPNQPAVLKLAV